MSYLLVKHNETYKITNKIFTKYNGNFKRVNKALKKVNNTWQSIWQRQIGDVCLLQFNDFSDDSGKIWSIVGNPQVMVDENAIDGNCLYLDGESYLQADANSIADFSNGAFTIECWIKPDPFNSNMIIFNSSDEKIDYFTMGIKYSKTIFMTAYWSSRDIYAVLNMSMQNIDIYDGKWHHIAAVRRDRGLKTSWFYDGKFINSVTGWYGCEIIAGNKATIGCQYNDQNGSTYKGKIDQFRITKGELYSEDFTPIKRPYMFND